MWRRSSSGSGGRLGLVVVCGRPIRRAVTAQARRHETHQHTNTRTHKHAAPHHGLPTAPKPSSGSHRGPLSHLLRDDDGVAVSPRLTLPTSSITPNITPSPRPATCLHVPLSLCVTTVRVTEPPGSGWWRRGRARRVFVAHWRACFESPLGRGWERAWAWCCCCLGLCCGGRAWDQGRVGVLDGVGEDEDAVAVAAPGGE